MLDNEIYLLNFKDFILREKLKFCIDVLFFILSKYISLKGKLLNLISVNDLKIFCNNGISRNVHNATIAREDKII